MLFQGKIDRAFKHLKEEHGEEEEKRREYELELEKGDMLALLISAFAVIVPVALVVLLVLGAIGALFFFH